MPKYAPFQRNEIEDTLENQQQLEKLLAKLSAVEAEQDSQTVLKLTGQIGTAYRLVGNFRQATTYFEKTVSLAQQIKAETAEVANLIRLATMLQYQDRHAEALPLFYRALEKCQISKITQYEDFACQHLAKCLVELGQVEESITLFEQALRLREGKGEVELIASTRCALEAAKLL